MKVSAVRGSAHRGSPGGSDFTYLGRFLQGSVGQELGNQEVEFCEPRKKTRRQILSHFAAAAAGRRFVRSQMMGLFLLGAAATAERSES